MLSARYLERLPNELVDIFAELETSIIDDICRRISKAKFDTPTAEWQQEKLRQIGYMQKEIDKLIASKLKHINKEVYGILYDSVDFSIETDNRTYKKAYDEGQLLTYPLDLKDNKTLLDIMDSSIKQTQYEFINFTRTTAVMASREFINALDLGWLQNQTGVFTREQIVKSIVGKLGRNGLTVVDYASRRREQLDVAVRRAIVTGTNKTNGIVSENRLRELGCKLVYTTSHIGARPQHEVWQGKVFYYNEPVDGYKDFRMSTGYGEKLGLSGINCRHSWGPFYEGISKITAPEYNKKESDELYVQEQEQRRLERNIRKWKRANNAMVAANIDNSFESLKVKEWQSKLNEHCKKYGLTKQYARTRVE